MELINRQDALDIAGKLLVGAEQSHKSDLKTCPFCGGEAYARFEFDKRSTFGYASVECKKCGAVPYVHQAYSGLNKEQATEGVVKAWNRRV